MIISLDKRAIYVGMPHTASSSIHTYSEPFASETLIMNGWVKKHETLNGVSKMLKEEHGIQINGDWSVVCFTRDPIDFFISEYFLLERMCAIADRLQIDSWKRQVVEFCEAGDTLDKYVLDRIERIQNFDEVINFYVGVADADPATRDVRKMLLPYEDFENSFNTTCDVLGIPQGECPKTNQKSEDQKKQRLLPETVEILKNAGI